MILAYLIFAHLLSDFILQPTKLFIWKNKSMLGVFVHVLVHLALNTIMLLPLLLNGHGWLLYVIAAICFVHFFLDQTKIAYDSSHNNKVAPFLLDQIMHFLTITIGYVFISDYKFVLPEGDFYSFYSTTHIPIFLSLMVITTAGVEIYRFQHIREQNPRSKLTLNRKKIAIRALNLALFYLLFILLNHFLPAL